MTKTYKISGMSCNHCRAHVENALNSIEGVKAVVTLTPPQATIEFSNEPLPLNQLQAIIEEEAGDYTLSEL